MNNKASYFGYSPDEFSHKIMSAMRFAMKYIRKKRTNFTSTKKGVSSSGGIDYVTDVDIAMQEFYVKAFQELFPGIGFIGEEESLFIESTGVEGVTFTIDPLDGTNAFVRGQSHGISTMIGILVDGELAGGYVGDVMTGEIYAAELGIDGVRHYDADGTHQSLESAAHSPLINQYLLCRHPPERSGEVADALVAYNKSNRLFGDLLIDTGSIGLHFARLWKGEVGGFLIEPSTTTPWDHTPCYAISKRLGIAQIGLDSVLWPTEYAPVETVSKVGRAMFYLPKSSLEELQEWYAVYASRS